MEQGWKGCSAALLRNKQSKAPFCFRFFWKSGLYPAVDIPEHFTSTGMMETQTTVVSVHTVHGKETQVHWLEGNQCALQMPRAGQQKDSLL